MFDSAKKKKEGINKRRGNGFDNPPGVRRKATTGQKKGGGPAPRDRGALVDRREKRRKGPAEPPFLGGDVRPVRKSIVLLKRERVQLSGGRGSQNGPFKRRAAFGFADGL